MTFYIKQNDTAPALRAQLKDGDGDGVTLTGATIRFHMKRIGGNTVVVDAAADAVVSAVTTGLVQYDWSAADTASVGTYHGEFEVTFSDGSIETFPNNGFITIEVTDDIT